jgi:hypothetical protein
MRAFLFSMTACFLLLLFGCSSKEAGVPLRFNLSDQDQNGAAVIPTNAAALAVSEMQMVRAETPQRRITIKLLPTDASAFERLTTDNFGKTVVVVQGTNVVATTRISEPISAQAGIILPIRTNVDFEHTYQDLLKLSRQ